MEYISRFLPYNEDSFSAYNLCTFGNSNVSSFSSSSVNSIVMLAVILKKIDLTLPEVYIGVAAWSAWTCIMFLPAMHERYFYIVDILLLLLALVIPRKYLILFIAEELVSILSTYLRCMLFIPIKLEIISVMNIMIYIIFSVLLAIHIVKLQRSRDTIATDN